jgi:MFS family permease
MGWLRAFPVALDSDDALNFAHGVVRFSVLEFSPHFPGYPAFIWLARLLNLAVDNPAAAVQWASLLGSSLLPPLSALLAARLWQRPALLAPVWLTAMALPLTPTLALSGLSDGPALAAWLGALLTLRSSSLALSASSRRLALAGLLVGLLLALRPSYFVLALLPLWQGWQHKGQRLAFLAPIALVGLACLLFVWQADGWAYFSEGRRFTDGHFHLWGNTAAAHGSRLLSWGQTLNTQFSPLWPLLMGMLLWPLWSKAKPIHLDRSWILGWLALLLWTLFGQNPDNPRHLAPILYLGLILLAGCLPAATPVASWPMKAAMLGALALLITTLISPSLPAMSQASALAEQRCPALVTQWGVRLLRESTALPVTDGWYGGDARLALAQGACRLSRRPLAASELPGPYEVLWFAPRFRAEPGLWLAIPRQG